MGLLHETLAVEKTLKATAENVMRETANTFAKKHEHFRGLHKKYTPRDDDGMQYADEHSPIVTTVKDKLDYTEKHIVKALDAFYQLELANTKSTGTVELSDTVKLENIPTTVLLNLEKRMKVVREVYSYIPTLDPGREWKKDSSADNTWIGTFPVETLKQIKNEMWVEVSKATTEHPAQLKQQVKDEILGTWSATHRSGMITPKQKSDYLEKIDIVIRELTKARQRANCAKVENVTIGKAIFDFINS